MSESYILLRAALNLFKKTPAQLLENELQQVQKHARQEWLIENRVLSSLEASSVVISQQEIDYAYDEIYQRYADEQQFLTELAQNDLTPERLKEALHRQCKVTAVLDRVGSKAAKVNEVEIGLYYHLHPEKFSKPERRNVSHILISINADYPENTREQAWQRINQVREKVLKKPYKFADLALKHSECPTALQGGDLGTVQKGKLYPQLDAVLFKLKANEISEAIESEIGFHILYCKHVHKAEILPFEKAAPKIREFMEERAKQNCVRAWLANLPK